MAFNIADVLGNVPRASDGPEQITYIGLDLLDPDPNNFYSLEGLDELAGNIELIGLQQPIRVRPGQAGRYIVVSGHRRRAACVMIQDGGSDQFSKGVPCIVDYGEASEAMRELRLIYANAATRVMSPSERSRQAERVEMLLYSLKEEGVEFPGRMRDHVAEACQVSKTKLARLHAIRNNLIPDLLAYFDRNEMTEELAYQMSRLPEKAQAAAHTCLMTGKRKNMPYAYQVEYVLKHLDDFTKPAKCAAHAGSPDCTFTEVHICQSLWSPYGDCLTASIGRNKDGICCRQCSYSGSCSWACQECKDRRKLDAAVEKEKQAAQAKKEADERERTQKKFRKQRQAQALRIKRMCDELGLIDECQLPTKHGWDEGPTVKEIEQAAAGEFGDKYFYDGNLLPDATAALLKWAEFLECSADYLLGLSDEPHPPVSGPDTAPTWQTGEPQEPGDYVIICGLPKEETQGSWTKVIQRWSGDGWIDGRGVPLRLNVYRWIRIPEV